MHSAEKRSWSEAFGAFIHPRVITMLFMGLSAGIPILLIFSTLSIWLREAGVDRSTVTYFSWAALGYSFKFVWAPLIDRLPFPVLHGILGRRRSWLIIAQGCIIGAILWMGLTDPAQNLTMMAFAAVALGFASATQDIVIDAYRIEAADTDLQAMMSSAYIGGYRIGMIVAGAGALTIAGLFEAEGSYQPFAWTMAYGCMALAMCIGVITTLLIREPAVNRTDSKYFHETSDYVRFLAMFAVTVIAFILANLYAGDITDPLKAILRDGGMISELAGFIAGTLKLAISIAVAILVAWLTTRVGLTPTGMVRETYIAPVKDFIDRYGKAAIIILILIGVYRIADIVMGVMANVFYTDLGFSKEEIAAVSKTFGLFMTIAGSFMGGVLSVRYGVVRILFVGALLSAITNILFAFMAHMGANTIMFAVVIMADNLSGGLATAAFIAYLSGLTNISFTAMQYAIFSSIMTLFPKILAGFSGTVVDAVGYSWFFIGTAIIGIPVLYLVVLAGRLTDVENPNKDSMPAKAEG
ncbi:AmpG family muropeptide MFS transporter [Thalassospira lucentensis]|uniref:AmpG family muropeptide MFS transporter n=1 Tax=Thalassospira lucentensis TaxID=168935 RepID=UPI0003B41577|nr:MFS transporter [Thalassospira lucentensis]RCK29067.1 MFS transporter [Thalassospira lucentensis MCCC 1A00383 = DSM 14000]